jgi:hypothetical protein
LASSLRVERQPPIAMRLKVYVGFHVSNADASDLRRLKRRSFAT